MIYTYPVCFFQDENAVSVDVPDLPGCITFGRNMTEAIEMAKDAMGGWLYTSLQDGEELPEPTPVNEVVPDEEFMKCIMVNLVNVDMDAYTQKYRTKAVHKNCTIPAWLNERALRNGINFSNALQAGIKQQLGMA
jgi:predicted RNase H-like HicB family nuclease